MNNRIKRNQFGKNNPNYKNGKYIENKCLCGKVIAPKSKLCRKCFFKNKKGINSPNFKDGRTLKKHYCKEKDCNKEISIFSGVYGSGKCKSCALRENKTHYFCLCGKEISYNTFHYGKKRCSKCNGKEHSKRIKSNKNPIWIDGRSLKKYYCKSCPKEINWKTVIRGKGCCSSCARKEVEISKKTRLKISKRMKGKNHPNFGNRGKEAFGYINGKGYEPYTSDFNDSLKESIRKRDNYECQNCSMTEEEHLIVIGRNLDIHHIDYNKKNCKEDNLISLCQQCNLRANGNRNYWIEYFRTIMEKKLCLKNG